MNLLCISCTSPFKDGRLQTLLNILGLKKNLYFLGQNLDNETKRKYSIREVNHPYIEFISSFLFNQKRYDKLLINNRKSILTFLFMFGPLLFKSDILYDMREFYEYRKHHSFRNIIGTIIERVFIVVFVKTLIVANDERRRFVRIIFPNINVVVIENIRSLPVVNEKVLKDKRLRLFKENLDSQICKEKLHFLSTDGINPARGISEIVRDLIGDECKFHIHFCGKVTDHKLLMELKRNNKVTYHGTLNQLELSILIDYMDVGIVRYPKIDRNNRYCASGKIYEFCLKGLPILASENLPLKKFIRKYGVGVCENNLAFASQLILKKLPEFRASAEAFSRFYCVKDYERQKTLELKNRKLL